MFKLGEKVHFKRSQVKVLDPRHASQVGTVIDSQFSLTSKKQWCRVQFNLGVHDFVDVGAWRLEKAR